MALVTKSDDRYDLPGLAATLVLHGLLALMLLLRPALPEKRRVVVEVDFKKKQPPPQAPLTPPPPPPPPVVEPPKKITKQPRPAETPRPSQAPVEPPKPVAPAFGLSPDQVSPNGTGISVPTGNTTIADPNQRPKVAVEPLPPSSGSAGKEFRPVAESDLRAIPAHDSDACTAGLKEKYSRSEAYAAGVEGEVVFRIELDELGKIRSIKKVKGIGSGIDEMAMGWLRFNPRCKFKPAIARDGQNAAFLIERYSITFELGQ